MELKEKLQALRQESKAGAHKVLLASVAKEPSGLKFSRAALLRWALNFRIATVCKNYLILT